MDYRNGKRKLAIRWEDHGGTWEMHRVNYETEKAMRIWETMNITWVI